MKDNTWKFLPCASYDVEKIETFLNDMSKEGYKVQKSGILFNVVYFEKSNQRYYYHLVPKIQKDKDETAFMLLQEEKGYLYIDTIGDFYIYAYTKPFEIIVDIKHYKRLKRYVIETFLAGIFTILIFLLFEIKMTLMLFVLYCGSFLSFMMLMIFVGWMIGKINKYLIYKDLYNKYALQYKREESEWKETRRIYPVFQFTKIILIFTIVLCMFVRLNPDEKDLPKDISMIPFTTLSNFETGEFNYSRDTTFLGSVKIFSDLLSPINYEWEEAGDYNPVRPTTMSNYAILFADYHETIHPFIASQLVKEYTYRNLHHDHYNYVEVEIDANKYGLDDLIVLTDRHHSVYIVRLDKKVICFDLSWDSSHHQMDNVIPILKQSLEC